MTPDPTKPASVSNYVWAVVILVLVGAVMTLGIIYLRPAVDPMSVMAQVTGVLTPTTAAVLAFMKSQETHLSVNSRLDGFMTEHAKNARNEGVIAGVEQERARLAPVPTQINGDITTTVTTKTDPGRGLMHE